MVKLQHQCQKCGRFLADEDHFLVESVALELKASSRKHIDMPNYVCRNCIGSTTCGPTHTVSFIAH